MKTIFISIPWFIPAFKAGGPILSIANMVNELDEGYQFYIYTSNTDLHGLPIAIALTNQWTEYNGYTKVWYANRKDRSQNLVDQVKQVKPDVLFIIGLFDWHFNIVPLLYADCCDKLLSVRGMLHPGALGQKKMKKQLFLKMMKWMKLDKKCRFHATDEAEAEYIRHIFGNEAGVSIATNFPRLLPVQPVPIKDPGILELVSIGIVSPMKNYLLVLKSLQQVKAKLHYEIYGPVKEPIYWEECLQAIKALPSNITVAYFPELPPHKIVSRLEGKHLFILPSRSENYGHAIVEALSSGLPVITSNNVPWQQLEEASAGMNIAAEENELSEAVEKFAAMGSEEYSKYRAGAVQYINEKIAVDELKSVYREMFGAKDKD